MSKEAFYFIVCSILLLQVQQISSPVLETLELLICGVLILTIGVSHGGIDNLLHQSKVKVSNTKFIAYYLLVALINVILWIVNPNFGFLLFILISSYHFGQSQFIEYDLKSSLLNRFIYFLWGALLIVALVFFNKSELSDSTWNQSFSISYLDLMVEHSFELFISLAILTFGLLIYKLKEGVITTNDFLIEVYQFALICIAFKLFSVILGFTLYFIILHSLKVLNHEYSFLKTKLKVSNIFSFVKLLLPFTLISLVGIGIITFAIFYFELNISLPLLALILTSSVTLPHTYVMEVFYDSSFK